MRTSDWSSDVCSSDLKTTGFFGWFNRTFDNGAERYERGLGRVIRSPKRAILLYGLLIIGLGAMFVRLPTGFLPEEDQGTIIALVQLPAGATAHRTTAVNDQMSEYLRGPEKHNVTSVFSVNGFSLAGRGQNMGVTFVNLAPWDERKGKDNKHGSTQVGKECVRTCIARWSPVN